MRIYSFALQIELAAYFVNDFMAKIADMNVLTAETHVVSGFEQLIQAIEQQMEA